MPRVREIEVFRLVLPYGRRPESILVRLIDYGGMDGWGEVVDADPKIWAALEEGLARALIGVDWEHPDELGAVPGGSAADMACWDLWTKMRGVPLSHALGGNRTSLIATARIGGERNLESLVARVNRLVCAGYAHVTLDVHPDWDIEPLRAVRHTYPALGIGVDARGALHRHRRARGAGRLHTSHPSNVRSPISPTTPTCRNASPPRFCSTCPRWPSSTRRSPRGRAGRCCCAPRRWDPCVRYGERTTTPWRRAGRSPAPVARAPAWPGRPRSPRPACPAAVSPATWPNLRAARRSSPRPSAPPAGWWPCRSPSRASATALTRRVSAVSPRILTTPVDRAGHRGR